MQISERVIVQKYGGAALVSVEAIQRAARRVAETRTSGQPLCIVVSAMGATTDDLIGLAKRAGGPSVERELDALMACGETMSAALFAMCLKAEGIRAISLSGPQAGIVTTNDHGKAEVRSVRPDRVAALIAEGVVPVVAGFQGATPGGDVTTLGRGGSDLTAVLLGAALEASAVELYKDVDGIYDRDPTEHDDANLFARMDYDRLLAVLAEGGHAVVQSNAVEYARKHRVILRVVPFSPSKEDRTGTIVKMVSRMPGRPSFAPSLVPDSMAGVRIELARTPSIPRDIPVSESQPTDVGIFNEMESNVRTYCRSFPTVFSKAKGALMWDEAGRSFIDFFAGAGALNYGHNPDFIRDRLIEHLQSDALTHALDMFTPTKRRFLETFRDVIILPRSLDYKVQFCGPTGANSVEAALKLARLATGRVNIASFTGGWHGMTAACLSVTGNKEHRESAGAPLPFTTVLPYPDGPYRLQDALGYVESLFDDPNSGFDLPAAVILETVQGEGGIYVAPPEWLKGIRALCDKHGVLMIADDVQVGCGRAGSFFSFERAGIIPDLVCLSKSIGGYGLPMSLLLMKPELDVWKPGQHTGTFRGNQLAFLAATEALGLWKGKHFEKSIAERAAIVEKSLRGYIAPLHPDLEVRGIGLMWGLDTRNAGGPEVAKKIGQRCFEQGLIIERCGRDDTVLKVMPPLTIDLETLKQGCRILEEAAQTVLGAVAPPSMAPPSVSA